MSVFCELMCARRELGPYRINVRRACSPVRKRARQQLAASSFGVPMLRRRPSCPISGRLIIAVRRAIDGRIFSGE